MVDRKSDVRSSGVGGNISHQLAAQPALAQISVADTAAQIGNQANRVGQQIIQQNNQFKQAVIQADNTAVYANSMNQATIAYQNLFQERINQQVDSDGNPTFSTLQDDVAQIGRDVSQEILNNIDSPEVRAQFQQNFDSYTGNQQIASIGIARNQQLSFISASVSNSLQQFATNAGSGSEEERAFWDTQAQQVLDSAVNSGAMTFDQQQVAQDKYRKEVSTAVTRNAILENPQSALDIIQNTPAEQLGLTETERLSLQREAQVAATREENATIALAVEQDNYLRDQLKDFEKMIDLGVDIPQDSIDNVTQMVIGTEHEEKLARIFHDSDIIDKFALESPTERQTLLNNLESSTTLDVEGKQLLKKLKTVDTNINREIEKDVYSFAIQQQVISPVEAFDANGDIRQQLADRLSSMRAVETQYNKRTSALTNTEMSAFVEKYEDGAYQVRSKMLGDVADGLGDDALFFNQTLVDKGHSDIADIGVLFQNGEVDTAVEILQGQDAIKIQKDIIPSDYRIIEAEALRVDLPHYDSLEEQESKRSMIMSLYASKVSGSGEFGTVTNKKIVKEAIEQVTNGGAINYKSNKVEPPFNGTSKNEFIRMIRSIDAADIDMLGGFDGFDSEDVPGILQNAELVSFGSGQYLVYLDNFNGVPSSVVNKDGGDFILDFNVLLGDGTRPIASKISLTPRQEADREKLDESFGFNRNRIDR